MLRLLFRGKLVETMLQLKLEKHMFIVLLLRMIIEMLLLKILDTTSKVSMNVMISKVEIVSEFRI